MSKTGPMLPNFNRGDGLRADDLNKIVQAVASILGGDLGGFVGSGGVVAGRGGPGGVSMVMALVGDPIATMDETETHYPGWWYEWQEVSMVYEAGDLSAGYRWEVRTNGLDTNSGPLYIPWGTKFPADVVLPIYRMTAEDGMVFWVGHTPPTVIEGEISEVSTPDSEALAINVMYKATDLAGVYSTINFQYPYYRPFNDKPLIAPAAVGDRCLLQVQTPFHPDGIGSTDPVRILFAPETLAFGDCPSNLYSYSRDTDDNSESFLTLSVGLEYVVSRTGNLCFGVSDPTTPIDNPEDQIILSRSLEIVASETGSPIVATVIEDVDATVSSNYWDTLLFSQSVDTIFTGRSALGIVGVVGGEAGLGGGGVTL